MNAPAEARCDARYLEWIQEFPLRPIRSAEDYRDASAILGRLAVRDEDSLSRGEQDYLETMTLLIADYDERHHRVDTSRLTPLDLLKHLMGARGMKAVDLGKILDSAPSASSG